MQSARETYVLKCLDDALRHGGVSAGLELEIVHVLREAVVVVQQRVFVSIIGDCSTFVSFTAPHPFGEDELTQTLFLSLPMSAEDDDSLRLIFLKECRSEILQELGKNSSGSHAPINSIQEKG